ncbi:MAG: signal peptidase II [Gammaproteobacteria bacterium]
MKKGFFLLSAVVVILDQISKYLANNSLEYAQPFVVFPSFNLTLLYNRGAAFSFLNDAGGWQRWLFTGIALFAIVFIVNWLRKLSDKEWLLAFALSFILGGAIGNLIDRVWFGYVIDFIQVYYQSWFFPAFNLADSAITLGAILLIWNSLFGPKEDNN